MKRTSARLIRIASSPARPRTALSTHSYTPTPLSIPHSRSFLSGLFSSRKPTRPAPPPPPPPLYGPNELFYQLDKSPIPALRKKAAVIKSLAPCPTPSCGKKVEFSCPDCGFPTHCSEGHWSEGKQEHSEYCDRLREVNEDDHDLRSGRVIKEFEMPGAQDYESTPSFASWDSLYYTRNFTSIDTERARRHASKLLTYPMSVAAALHQNGPFTVGSGKGTKAREGNRWTREGTRSMAALHTSLHPPTGSAPSPQSRNAKIPIRIFVLGARAESSLPPHIWEQVNFLFPETQFKIFFIGPQAAMPVAAGGKSAAQQKRLEGLDPINTTTNSTETIRKIYSPATPTQNSETSGKGHLDTHAYGSNNPSYTISPSPLLQLTTIQSKYEDVHGLFGPFDPYTDVFFTFCPGFGFPSPSVKGSLQAEIEWKESITQILETKCPLFITSFSPTDLERDVSSLREIEGIKGEYDMLLEPGENGFGSLKWEPAEFDSRVMVRVNWGIWGIRGKRYEVQENRQE